jgi:biopolymer transport protein ExbD
MAFKPSAAKKNKRKEEGTLNMNSMMDILTIMLLFLLMSFSTEGSLATKSGGLQPPKILAKNKPKKSILVGVSSQQIFFNKEPIVDVDKVLAQKESYQIEELAVKLEEEAAKAIDLENRFGIEFKRELLVYADERMPFNILLKVVYTCGRHQFSNLRLMGNQAGIQEVM